MSAGRPRVAIAGGSNGQLRRALLASAPPGVEAVALAGPDGGRLDVTDRDAVHAAVRALAPEGIVNAAAWTAVDRAEAEPEAAAAVNAAGPAHLAEAARACGAHLVHVSTDFVFGAGDGTPFEEGAPTSPLGVYGRTKRDGELAALELAPGSAVVRTAWVHSASGSNFVLTMLRLMAERESLDVVADQLGAPTRAGSLALALWRTVELGAAGILHWTGAGVASWYDFAVAIAEEGAARGLVPAGRRVRPIPSRDYPTPAARPAYGVLSHLATRERLGIAPEHWREGLRATLDEVAAARAAPARPDAEPGADARSAPRRRQESPR